MCLECGRWLRTLGSHLHAMHAMDSAEYRYRHELPVGLALAARDLRDAYASSARALYPAKRERLQPGEAARARGLENARKAKRESASRAGTRILAQEQAAQRGRQQAARAAARHEERARELGYGSLAAFFAAFDAYPDRHAGMLLGVSETTASNLRARHAPGREVTGAARRAQQTRRSTRRLYDQRARAAGYATIAALLAACEGEPDRVVAGLLGVSVQTANRIRRDPRMLGVDFA